MSFLLKILCSVLILCVLVLVGVTMGLTLYKDEIEQKIADKVEQLSGREIQIREGFGFKFNPLPSVYAKDIVFANADWGTQPWMLTVEKAEVSFSFLGLAQGEIQIAEITIDSPYMLFERYQSKLNWLFEKSTDKTPKPLDKVFKYLLLNEVEINNAVLDIQVNPRKQKINFNRIIANVNPRKYDIAIEAIGSANNRVIQAEGLLTDVESMLLRKPSKMALSGTFGELFVKGSGTVQDVLKWQGLDVLLEATAPSLSFFQPWNRLKLPDTPAINVRAKFIQPKRWSSASLEQIEANMEGYGGRTTMEGEFTELQNWKGLNLSGTSQHQLNPLLAEIGWAGESDAQINASFTLQGAIREGLSLKLQQGSLTGAEINVAAKGEIDNLSQAESSSILLSGSTTSLHHVGAFLGRPWWPKTDAINAYAELAKLEGRFGLKNIQATSYDNTVSASGAVQNIGRFSTGEFAFEGTFNKQQIERFNQHNNRRLPEADSAAITSVIRYNDKVFSSAKTEVKLNIGNNQVQMVTAIGDLKSLSMQGAKLKIDISDMQSINALYDSKLPILGHLTATGLLSGALEPGFNIQDIQGHFESANHRIDTRGSISKLGPEMKADLEISFIASKLDDFQDQLSFDLPQNMGAEGTFGLTSLAANNWSANNINAELSAPDKGTIQGVVENFPLQTRYQLNVDIAKISIENVPQLAKIEGFKKRSLTFFAEVTTKPDGKVFSAKKIAATISESKSNTSVSVQGEVEDVARFSGLALNGQLSDGDLSAIPELKNLDLKPNLPLNINFSLKRGLSSNTLNFTIEKMQLDKSDLSGQLSVQLPTDKVVPYISGRLNSDNLDISALLKKTERKRMFSDAPYSLHWANRFNASIELSVKQFNGAIARITNAKTLIKVDQGLFTLAGAEGQIGAGNLTVWLVLDVTTDPYNMVSSIYGQGLDFKELNLLGDSELIKGGLLDVDLGVSGRGKSLAEMMGNAYGKLQLQLHNASIKNQNIELFGSDLILGFLNIINPLSRQEQYLDIECGAIHFPINNGRAYADQGIAIKTDRVTVLGGGEINLRNEELQILIKPKARQGFGLSTSTIAKIVQISGTIDKPKIEAATSGFFSTLASIGLAAASGGWSLLAQGLLDRHKANSNVCNQTLKSPVFVAASESRPLNTNNQSN